MRTYERNRYCLVFDEVAGDKVSFKKVPVVEVSNAQGFQMFARVPNTRQYVMPTNPHQWPEAIEEAARHILFLEHHFVGVAELRGAKTWEEMDDGSRVSHPDSQPVLLRDQREKALQAIGGDVLTFARRG